MKLTKEHRKILDKYGCIFFDGTTLAEYYQLCKQAKRYLDKQKGESYAKLV